MINVKKNSVPVILVADDSPTALKVTSAVLSKNGYKVVQVMDGEQAVNEALRIKPSAVVVDLKMPKKDGFQVCMELKNEKKIYFPILLLTAREDIESMVRGLESGADDYIVKPFIEMEFIARIKVMLRLKKLNDELMHANRKLKYLSTHDELTGLYNHRYFISVFEKLMNSARNDKTSISLAIFDIDHFKSINDTYGHLEGDQVLQKIARHLSDSFTSDTILARYGGEEFTALFINRSMDFVVNVCQKIIDDYRGLSFQHNQINYHLSLSAGISSTDAIRTFSTSELIQSADKLLYHSKNTGRNKLTFFTPGAI